MSSKKNLHALERRIKMSCSSFWTCCLDMCIFLWSLWIYSACSVRGVVGTEVDLVTPQSEQEDKTHFTHTDTWTALQENIVSLADHVSPFATVLLLYSLSIYHSIPFVLFHKKTNKKPCFCNPNAHVYICRETTGLQHLLLLRLEDKSAISTLLVCACVLILHWNAHEHAHCSQSTSINRMRLDHALSSALCRKEMGIQKKGREKMLLKKRKDEKNRRRAAVI